MPILAARGRSVRPRAGRRATDALVEGDAQVGLTASAGQQIEAEHDLASARGQLLDALGRS